MTEQESPEFSFYRLLWENILPGILVVCIPTITGFQVANYVTQLQTSLAVEQLEKATDEKNAAVNALAERVNNLQVDIAALKARTK